MAVLRAQVAPNKGKLQGIAARPAFEAISERVVAAEGVEFRRDVVGGIPGFWCTPAAARPDITLMHLHGGWFTWGSAAGFRNLVGHLSSRSGIRAFIPDYRLAPENPYPAALEDALACFQGLSGRGVERVAVSGDSAGGNLALLLAAADETAPAGVVAISPVTDLAMTGASWTTKAKDDPYFTRSQVKSLVDGYLGTHDPADPRASPLYGVLSKIPPVAIHAGTDEVLLDDATRYAELAVRAGAEVQLHIWEGMPHGVLSGVGQFQAADAALDLVAEFLKLH
jgi:acetyl esterase/lipase